jgi:hypothetical protein
MSPETNMPEPPDVTAKLEAPEHLHRTEQLETEPLGTVPADHTALSPAPSTAAASSGVPEPTGWTARGVRMRTVVLGLVLLAVSATTLVRVLTGVDVDDSLVALVLLVVAGVLLLGGGVASAAREARAGRARR